MPRPAGRSYLVFEALVAVSLSLAATQLPTPRAGLEEILGFLLVMTILSLFDVWLPQGDVVDIVGPLSFAALVLSGPVAAIGLAAGARLVAHVLRYGFDDTSSLLHGLSRRTIVIVGCGLLLNEVDHKWFWQPVEITPGLVAVAVAFVAGDLVLQQAYSAMRHRQSIGGLLLGNLQLQGLMLAASASVALLTVMLYESMWFWTLVLMGVLLLVMRQSFSLFIEIRQAYQATMAAMAAAIEAHDPLRKGHAERVAALAKAIGNEIGVRGQDLEILSYAALLHDVDLLGETSEEIPSAAVVEQGGSVFLGPGASNVLAEVGFLSDVLPVLRLCEGVDSGENPNRARDGLLAYVVCRASNLDEALNQRGGDTRVRQYGAAHLGGLVEAEARERVEGALWKLLTPGARTA